MTDIQSGSTNREIINYLEDLKSETHVSSERKALQITIAWVASMETLQHRLDELVTYMASIDSSLRLK